ncbi:MAG: DUF5684 domain-containing protein [Chloroflexota bacterium]
MSWIMLAQQTSLRGSQSTMGIFFMGMIYIGAMLFVIAPIWNVLQKAGKPGWVSIVPIYNMVVLLQIAGRPGWWFVLLAIPGVNLIISVLWSIDVAKSFGKGNAFGVGLALLGPICWLILGFDGSNYQGPTTS